MDFNDMTLLLFSGSAEIKGNAGSKKNLCSTEYGTQACRPLGCRRCHSTPRFCRSVNPISTRRWRLCPTHHYWHPRIFRPSYGPAYKRLLDELQLQKHGFPYLEENKKDRWEKFVSKMDHYATCMQEIKNFFCMFAFHYNSSLKQGGIPRKLQL